MTSILSNTAMTPNDSVCWRPRFCRATEWVAPTWPLDQLIAVNPWWEMRHLPMRQVAARMAALGKVTMLAPEALQTAAQALPIDVEHVQRRASDQPGHWLNVSDLVDQRRDLVHRMSWHDEIVEQISRFAARYFSAQAQVSKDPAQLYETWLQSLRDDTGIAVLMGEPRIGDEIAHLPNDIDTVFNELAGRLELEPTAVEYYGHALLLDIKGWAAWVAYLRWQDRLNGEPNNLMDGLLAIRAAWELLLCRYVAAHDPTSAQQIRFQWRGQQGAVERLLESHRQHQTGDWQVQEIAERAYQAQLAEGLLTADANSMTAKPSLQAAFCIDVRSEAFRRHLEAQHPGIQTIGFAGFFGLPIDYRQAGSSVARPQLPGLLKPALRVTDCGDEDKARARHQGSARWMTLGESAPAMFGLVEAVGIAYAWRLFKRGVLGDDTRQSEQGDLTITDESGELSVRERADLAAKVLAAMGLQGTLADIVLLVGHGSSNCNNAHAASLDCGACGGQSGEVNVRLLAQLLNEEAVREVLRKDGLEIPDATRFVPALHDTTTDEVSCLVRDECPARISEWLTAAAAATRRERYHASDALADDEMANAALRRATDWSEVRPEWGLAGNAAFIAAPRARTRHLNLGGRVFLHDYQWQRDDGALLELILTAPMVVANWINLQYNASVADNLNYGGGSKTLHNVVGGRLGVIEGQGGDLRIGLPLQSVHDGERWMHTPLRLSVYVEAPRDAIDAIYTKHQVVRELVDNEWLFLFQIDDDAIWRLRDGAWSAEFAALSGVMS